MLSTSLQSRDVFKGASEYYSLAAKGPMLDRVYSMRYRSYSAEDYIEKNSSHKFMDEYDAKVNCTSFLTYFENKPIGSIRSCVYTPGEGNVVPVMEVFGAELGESIGYNSTFIEANKFVVDPSFQGRGGVKARFSVYENIANQTLEHNAAYLVAGIRTEHIKFYSSLFFELASEEKSYPHLSFKTVLVICRDVDAFRNKIYSKTRRNEVVNGSLFSHVSG